MTKQRIVVKIGSSSLTNYNGGLSEEKLTEHVEALAALKKAGHEVIVISSGAVAAGFTDLNYPTRPITLAGKQAAAAVGQSLLMQGYAEKFRQHNMIVAQLLLTRANFSNKDQYHNIYSTLTELLKRDAIPIINENDSVAVEEINFGDNDMLSSLVSGLIHANMLIILTDVNGIYDDNPQKNPHAKKYSFLPKITDELLGVAGGAGSKVGTGGMRSKIEAAKMALSLGVNVFIGSGHGEKKLLHILNGEGDGTYIGDSQYPLVKNKKQWIALHSDNKGFVQIDAGAEKALSKHGGSLLPAGIIATSGKFVAGDVVSVTNEAGNIIGKGIINFSSDELQTIKGLSSEEAMMRTKSEKQEAIHRDNWVTMDEEMMINE